MKLRGIKIGSFHTGNDWHLTMTKKPNEPAEPKTYYISVDGRDGDLDITEGLTGDVKYENRNYTYEFDMTDGNIDERIKLMTFIVRQIHGRICMIIEDDDIDHYLQGRCMISNVHHKNAYSSFAIKAKLDPWRYAKIPISRIAQVSGVEIELACRNDGMKTLVPELTIDGQITIKKDQLSIALSTGVYKVPELKLKEGLNILTVGGNGTLTVKYREAIM